MRSKTVVPIVVVTVVVAGLAAFFVNQTAIDGAVKGGETGIGAAVDDVQSAAGEAAATEEQIASAEEGAMMEKETVSYSGEVIAGSATPYIRYNKADFDKALDEGKAVYVYFYATWCPLCKAERPSVLSGFDGLGETGAVGFEAHWGDGQNTAEDDNLARDYGVSSQHTHIFIGKDGKVAERVIGSLDGNLAEKISALAGA